MISLSSPDKEVLIAFTKLKKDIYFKAILDYLRHNQLKLSADAETGSGDDETFKLLGASKVLREFLNKIANSEKSLERVNN